MKKILAAMLAMIMILAVCTACSGKTDPTTIEPADSAEPVDAASAEPEKSEEAIPDTADYSMTFQAPVLDTDVVKIEVLDAAKDGDSYFWQINLENKIDSDIFVNIADVAINGVACDPFWGDTVPANESVISEIVWRSDVMNKAGIEDVTAVQMTISAWHCDDYTDVLQDTIVNVYPNGEENAELVAFEPAEDDVTVLNNDKYALYITDATNDGMGGYVVDVVFVNKMMDSIMMSMEPAMVNGSECDPYWAETVPAQALTYSTIGFASVTLDVAGISATDVSTIDFKGQIYEGANWNTSMVTNVAFALDVAEDGMSVELSASDEMQYENAEEEAINVELEGEPEVIEEAPEE